MKIVNIVFSHQFASKVPHTRRLDPDLGQISTRPRSPTPPRPHLGPISAQSRPPPRPLTRDRSAPVPPRTPHRPPRAAESRVPTSPSLRTSRTSPNRPSARLRPNESTSANSFLSHDWHAPRAPVACPIPTAPTGHHPAARRVALHRRANLLTRPTSYTKVTLARRIRVILSVLLLRTKEQYTTYKLQDRLPHSFSA